MQKITKSDREWNDVLEADPVIRILFQKYGMPPSDRESDLFQALIRSIVGQQLSLAAARTIYNRFLQLFDGMPAPEAILDADPVRMRGAGLSGQKTQYLQNISQFFLDQSLLDTAWDRMSDEAIIQLLVQIKGVGLWTIQMLLMFPLDRPDVFPLGDLGIRNEMTKRYDLQETGRDLDRRLMEISGVWAPFRTSASKIIWMSKDDK